MSRPIQTPRKHKARIAGVVAAALVISWGAPAANAYWQTLNSSNGGARADSILGIAAPTASASAGAASVSWAQSTTAAGRPVSGYTVARYSSATGGTKVAAGGGCAGTVAALGCTEASLPGGTWYYAVTPVLGAWTGVESARSAGVTVADTTPPNTPIITAPAMISGDTAAASVLVSGTAEAGSSVTITVKDAGAVHTTSQTVVASSSGDWSAIFNLLTFDDPTISYSAVAKDAAGNVSVLAGTATSVKDTVPTAKVTLGGNDNGTADKGDTVSIKYSADINTNSICSAWSNGGATPDVAGNNLVTVTISSTNTLTVSTDTGALCALNIGPIAVGRNYVSSGSLTFKGTGNGGGATKVAWDNSTHTLIITLGTRNTASNTGVTTSSPTVVPPAGVKDVAGNQAIGAVPDAPSRF